MKTDRNLLTGICACTVVLLVASAGQANVIVYSDTNGENNYVPPVDDGTASRPTGAIDGQYLPLPGNQITLSNPNSEPLVGRNRCDRWLHA